MIAYTLQAALAQPDQIRSLVLYRQNLAYWPDTIFRLNQLEHLELDQCQIDHLDERLARLPIRKLVLPNNRVASIPIWLGEMSSLEILDISHNALTTWPSEATPPNLRSLILAHNRLRQLPVRLIIPLTHLDLRRNPLSNQDWPNELAHLESIRLEGSPRAASQFVNGHYPALTELSLTRCKLDHLPTTWSGRYPHLRHLDLANNQLQCLPDDLAEASPLLRQVQLSRNRLTQLPKKWSSAIHIMDLDLSGNHLTQCPESLTRLDWLVRLNLAGNPLTDLPDQVASMPRLESLNLRNTGLADLPTGPWPALVALQIHETPLAASEPFLRALPNRIRVSGKRKSTQPSSLSLARFRQMAEKAGWDTERQARLWTLTQEAEASRSAWSIRDHLDLWQLGCPGYPGALLRLNRNSTASGRFRSLSIFGRSWIPRQPLAERAAASGFAMADLSSADDADLILIGGPQDEAALLDPRRQTWTNEHGLLAILPPLPPPEHSSAPDPGQVVALLRSPLPTHQMMGQQLLVEQGIPNSLYGELLLIIRHKGIPNLQKNWPSLLIRFGQGDWVADCLAPRKTLNEEASALAIKWGADQDALRHWTGR